MIVLSFSRQIWTKPFLCFAIIRSVSCQLSVPLAGSETAAHLQSLGLVVELCGLLLGLLLADLGVPGGLGEHGQTRQASSETILLLTKRVSFEKCSICPEGMHPVKIKPQLRKSFSVLFLEFFGFGK